MGGIPDVITQDRSNVHKIIEEMLENPDDCGIYPTGEVYDKLESLINTARIEALGWTWAEACVQLDKGKDPRNYEQGRLIEMINRDLNPPWKPEGEKKGTSDEEMEVVC